MRAPRPLLLLALLAGVLLAGCALEPPRPPTPAPRGPTPPAPPADLWAEDWETGTEGWTFAGGGAAPDCGVSADGACSLRMAPACCGTRVVAEHPLELPLSAVRTVRFSFRGPTLDGDTDAEVRLVTEREHVVLTLTRPGTRGNNGISLGLGGPDDPPCGVWTRPDAWHSVTVVLHAQARQAYADVHDETGARIASCEHPMQGTTLRGFRVDGVDYGDGHAYHLDRMSVSP